MAGRLTWTWTAAALAVGFGMCAAVGQTPLTPVQQAELDTLGRQLSDPTRSVQTKVEAAELLLTRTYPQAAALVAEFLSSPSNRAARLAVAQAIAKNGAGGQMLYVKGLMGMVKTEEAALAGPAAEALAGYADRQVTDSLLALALDAKADRGVRIVVIRALAKVLDKQAVDALVRLLDDGAPAIRQAAGASLVKLTNIRAFGQDAARWKAWWAANKNKSRSQWLEDLAEALGRSQRETELENAVLRERLRKAVNDLYTATPPANRYARMVEFLKDPLADVRLEGLALADARVVSGEPAPEEVRKRVAEMLGDADWRVRAAAGPLLANIAEGTAVDLLMGRLRDEESPEVRQSLLTALGVLRDVKAVAAVLPEIMSKHDKVSGAAASALGQIAGKTPLDEATRVKAAKMLADRYQQAASSGDGAAVREKLLTAMSVVGRAEFLGLLQQALKDPDASVRQAAVNGMARLGNGRNAEALAPMVDDPDRGVRRAVIVALGSVGGLESLKTILKRTDPAAESEPSVRQQAWEETMRLLDKADASVLSTVAEELSTREDAAEQRIQVLKKLVSLLESGRSSRSAGALRLLGRAMLGANQPAEAAAHLAKAYAGMKQAGDPEAGAVWGEWVQAMLAADDPAVVAAMAAQTDRKALALAVRWFEGRLVELDRKKGYATVILLAGEAQKSLASRLTKEQREAIAKARSQAAERQLADDAQRVSQAAAKLTAADAAVRAKAAEDLQAMGDRAVRPLLKELLKVVRSEAGDGAGEKAILAVLRQTAPKLTGYDATAPREDRVKLLEKWLAE